jgi:hypothetical protein
MVNGKVFLLYFNDRCPHFHFSGGEGYSGPTACPAGAVCKAVSDLCLHLLPTTSLTITLPRSKTNGTLSAFPLELLWSPQHLSRYEPCIVFRMHTFQLRGLRDLEFGGLLGWLPQINR